jgi:integrase
VVSVRKRSWITRNGEPNEAWVADYVDQHGARHIKTFARKKDADRYHAQVAIDVGAGVHTAERASIMVVEAGRLWLESCEAAKLERTTLEQYRRQLDLHIVPLIGAVKLSALTVPAVRAFEDRLRTERSAAMVRKVLVSLSSILSNAQERGLVAQNVVRGLRARRGPLDRHQRKLKAGADIPTPDEIRAILGSLTGQARPLLLTAIFTGLRASELRGLRWADVDLKRNELHVHQRADRFSSIGAPKSAAGERTIPLLPMVVNGLREWRLVAGKNAQDLVFPSPRGQVAGRNGIVRRLWQPAQVQAGVVDAQGRAKYPGLHALRHFYASWCINRRADGGLELPLKLVQARLGHASIQITADVYGHLFPRGDDAAEMAAAEQAFLV